MATARTLPGELPVGMLACLLCLWGCSVQSSVTSVNVLASRTLLQPGESSMLVASVLGAGDFLPDVTWKLEPGAPGLLSASTGSSVLYTAPAMVAQSEAVSVVAASEEDVDVFGTAALTLEAGTDGGL
jgi:hypothetical protein